MEGSCERQVGKEPTVVGAVEIAAIKNAERSEPRPVIGADGCEIALT